MNKMSRKKLLVFYYTFLSVSWVLLFTPLAVIIIRNWDRYFNQNSGWTVGMGGVLAILLVVLALKFGTKKFNKIFWATSLLVVAYCLKTILDDTLVLTFGLWLGCILFTIFETPTKAFKRRLDTYNDEEQRMYVRKEAMKETEEEQISGRC